MASLIKDIRYAFRSLVRQPLESRFGRLGVGGGVRHRVAGGGERRLMPRLADAERDSGGAGVRHGVASGDESCAGPGGTLVAPPPSTSLYSAPPAMSTT